MRPARRWLLREAAAAGTFGARANSTRTGWPGYLGQRCFECGRRSRAAGSTCLPKGIIRLGCKRPADWPRDVASEWNCRAWSTMNPDSRSSIASTPLRQLKGKTPVFIG